MAPLDRCSILPLLHLLLCRVVAMLSFPGFILKVDKSCCLLWSSDFQLPPLPAYSLAGCDEVAYEERRYPAGKWACVTMGEPLYEQSISMSFMKLMRYICKENSVGCHLGMTIPVLNEIHLTKEGTKLEREVLTAYYLPGEFQQNPPVPMDPEIHITERAPLRVITRVFYGMTTEETILREISHFWELLGSTDSVLQETYIVASYENPSIPQRRNEIWFICRAE
ncbi:heme-binding protein 1-like isoform X2 [Corvus hawaiiensis]|uniref:heme-binding protein 1-like isoform X2 n=1 Tax=Corvus moneduloides TaxID=1196302 RepID=UPI00136277D3|nr:heme-binding protein 1-like isoform X2 [Corvus moneduloides]XP_048155222.1 heme-binding protein 1-like isoform X2 [Corvus hawaiiensis]